MKSLVVILVLGLAVNTFAANTTGNHTTSAPKSHLTPVRISVPAPVRVQVPVPVRVPVPVEVPVEAPVIVEVPVKVRIPVEVPVKIPVPVKVPVKVPVPVEVPVKVPHRCHEHSCSFCRHLPDGKYANRADHCRSYYECFNGHGTLFHCDFGKQFCEYSKKCIPDDRVKCRYPHPHHH